MFTVGLITVPGKSKESLNSMILALHERQHSLCCERNLFKTVILIIYVRRKTCVAKFLVSLTDALHHAKIRYRYVNANTACIQVCDHLFIQQMYYNIQHDTVQ